MSGSKEKTRVQREGTEAAWDVPDYISETGWLSSVRSTINVEHNQFSMQGHMEKDVPFHVSLHSLFGKEQKARKNSSKKEKMVLRRIQNKVDIVDNT